MVLAMLAMISIKAIIIITLPQYFIKKHLQLETKLSGREFITLLEVTKRRYL